MPAFKRLLYQRHFSSVRTRSSRRKAFFWRGKPKSNINHDENLAVRVGSWSTIDANSLCEPVRDVSRCVIVKLDGSIIEEPHVYRWSFFTQLIKQA
jgi:hypothetical protein